MDNHNQHLPDGLIPVEPLISEENFEKFKEYINSPEYKNYSANQIQQQMMNSIKSDLGNISSPEERLKFLTDKIDSIQSELTIQTEALQSSRYENMKLNAQISVLNKTIDSNEEKLDELRNTNAKLESVNATLKESNKHYWRNTFIISFIVAFIFFILGLLF